MLYHCQCPNCGQKQEYIPEQVGQTSFCRNCGSAFTPKANTGRVTWKIVVATFAVMGLVGGVAAKLSRKFNKRDREPDVKWTIDFSDD
jgi:hypothetical protein